MSYTCTFLYVENGTSWVADGLAKEQLGVGAECLLYFFLAYFKQLTLPQIDQMYLTAQPGYLQALHGGALDDMGRDGLRAEKIRAILA